MAHSASLPRRAPPAPAMPPLEAPSNGLTTAEANRSAEAGLANVDTTRQRTDGDVIRANALTFFNVVLFSTHLRALRRGRIPRRAFRRHRRRDERRRRHLPGNPRHAHACANWWRSRRHTQRSCATASSRRSSPNTSSRATCIHLKQGDQVVADGRIVDRTAESRRVPADGRVAIPCSAGPASELRSGSFCTAGDCYYIAEKVGVDAYAVKLTADAARAGTARRRRSSSASRASCASC